MDHAHLDMTDGSDRTDLYHWEDIIREFSFIFYDDTLLGEVREGGEKDTRDRVGFLLWFKGRILENPVVVVDDG